VLFRVYIGDFSRSFAYVSNVDQLLDDLRDDLQGKAAFSKLLVMPE
jgi:hypothetical protein